jgi:hypothetical protein
MKIKLELEVDIATTGDIASILREKALLVLAAKKCKLDNQPIPPDLKEKFDALNPPLEEKVKSIMPFADWQLLNVVWQTEDLVSKEEEAAILAPQG